GADESFVAKFGDRGLKDLKAAFVILEALPPVSQLSSHLTEREFLGEKRGVNHAAASAGLYHLSSAILSSVLLQLGLGPAQQHIWCIRDHTDAGPQHQSIVVVRNFDPVTWWPTPYLNGALFTYS